MIILNAYQANALILNIAATEVRIVLSKFTNIIMTNTTNIDPDCPDASDELNCPGMEDICNDESVKLLRCENTTACYMLSWRCDGDNDCWDSSDEINCGNSTCSSDQFSCPNGQCISLNWRCGECNYFKVFVSNH